MNLIYTKKDVSYQEYEIHKFVLENIPSILTPKINDYNQFTKTLIMEKIPEMSIADMYGDQAVETPNSIFNQIRKIIKKLNQNNIDYPDITGYNFIDYKDKLYIIDFGDASFIENSKMSSSFVKEFIDGLNEWNPDFR